MRVVQEAQPMHSLLNFVSRGFGVAIVPDPICWPSGCVVFKKLEDFELTASFRLTWLRRNDSPVLRDFIATTRQVASSPDGSFSFFDRPRKSANTSSRPKSRLSEPSFSGR
jgi:DNA-binding transcriptional LysR family regulator